MKMLKIQQILKTTCCLSLIIYLFNSCGAPDSPGLTDQEKEYLQAIYPAMAESWNAGNRQPYLDRLSDDAIYMVPNQELRAGKEAITEFVLAFPDLTSEYTVVEIWGNGTMANVRGKYTGRDAQGNVLDMGKFINLFQKNSEGKWVVTHDIWNSDLPVASENPDSED